MMRTFCLFVFFWIWGGRLFAEELLDTTGNDKKSQQADDDDETNQPATHCWHIACHLPVVPIHIIWTFTLANNGGGVAIEPGGVRCEVQRVRGALEVFVQPVAVGVCPTELAFLLTPAVPVVV